MKTITIKVSDSKYWKIMKDAQKNRVSISHMASAWFINASPKAPHEK